MHENIMNFESILNMSYYSVNDHLWLNFTVTLIQTEKNKLLDNTFYNQNFVLVQCVVYVC